MNLRSRRFLGALAFGGLLMWGSSGLAQNYVNLSHSPGWQSACPRICVDAAGNVHAVWAEIYAISGVYFLSGDAFYSKYDSFTQQWSSPLNLSNNGQVFNNEWYLVDIDADALGNIYVVFVSGSKIVLRILFAGTWSAPFEVATGGSTLDQTRVAVTPQGDIFTCWWETSAAICFSRARIGGTWEPVKQISPPGIRSKFADIAVGKSLAFCAMMAGTDVTYHVVVTGRALTAGAAWTSPIRPTTTADQEQQPTVAIDTSDVVHIVYTPELSMSRIVRYIFGTSGGFSSPLDLTGAGGLHYPQIYAKGTDVYVVWQDDRGVGTRNKIDGVWNDIAILPNTVTINSLTDVATSPSQDRVYYVWESGSGLNTDIFFSGPLTAPGNVPPTAAFSFLPTTGLFPLNVTFDASASNDPDGSITQYAWTFGDGGQGTGKVATHSYKTFGTFAVMLTVTDNKGATGTLTQNLQVLRLFQPLNIAVTSHSDESLFRVRYLNVITWDRNSANDSIGATISIYRVYRKKKTEPDSAYAAIADVTGSVFTFTDKTAKTAAEKDLFAYTVTALDSQGHESPIMGSFAGSPPVPIRSSLIRKSKLKG